jgi:large subunit ribosomal protein L10
MALSIEDKKKIVSDVNELANTASSLVLADARGLKVAEANELRSEGHKSDVKFRVAKKYISKIRS